MDEVGESDQHSHTDENEDECNEEDWARCQDSCGFGREAEELESVRPRECLTHGGWDVKGEELLVVLRLRTIRLVGSGADWWRDKIPRDSEMAIGVKGR